MEKKESKIYYRNKLLLTIMDKGISESTAKRITQPIMKAPEDSKESTAENMLNLLKNCKNEEEVMEALESYSFHLMQKTIK